MAKRIKKESFFKSTVPSVIIIILISFFAGFLIFSNWKIYQRRGDLVSQLKDLQKQIQETGKRNEELKAGMAQLSDQGYIEGMARERLGLQKPGEKVVIVVPPPEKQEAGTVKKTFLQTIFEKIKFW